MNLLPNGIERRLTRLADQLAANGALRGDPWRAALLATPRHAFLPEFYWPDPSTGQLERRTASDRDWLDLVYSDAPLVTQFDGEPTATSGIPTSSSTAPHLMLAMLEALEVEDGHRVLEIGTGTGYNAALVCHRVGDSNVTTIDVDETLTTTARKRLGSLGLNPTVVTGDGANGHPAGAPYDRIIATCAVRHIPSAWLEQVRPGGSIIATLESSLHGYALALIAVDEQQRGNGRILTEPASFMPMRSHADPTYAQLEAAAAPARWPPRPSRILVADIESDDARFVLGLALPDVASFTTPGGIYLAHHANHSWAELRADGTVIRGGTQDLWNILEDAHLDWMTAGSPSASRFAVTVVGRQQLLRFERPDGYAGLTYSLH